MRGMGTTSRLAAWAFLVAFAGGAAAAAQPQAAPCTVGDLAVRLAAEMGVRAEERTPEGARAFLAEVGVEVAAPLDRRLSEADTVTILNQFGANLTTSAPAAPVDSARLDRILGLALPEGLPGQSAGGCSGGGHCDPGWWLKQFCDKHPNLCKKVASHFSP